MINQKKPSDPENNKIGLRLYSASEMNDPNEGLILKNEFMKDYPWIVDAEDESKAFICSFVSSEEYDVANNITYWQAYGRDGLGCSIQPVISKELKQELFPAKYEKDLQEEVKHFQPFFEYGKEIHQRLNSEQQKEFTTNFWICFDPIKFLYKHVGYKKELEYRYVVVSPNDEDVFYHPSHIGNSLTIRSYINALNLVASKILISGSRIYIGPRVRYPQTVLDCFEKTAKEGDLDAKFEFSKIPYRGHK